MHTETYMTRAQVKHEAERSERDLLIIGDKVYDATEWKLSHPGGRLPIRVLRGRDATDPFRSTHSQSLAVKYVFCSFLLLNTQAFG